MKRILITTQSMEIGGVERSLIGLLEALKSEDVSVDLFVMKHGGAFERYLPDWIHLLPENRVCSCLTTPGIETLKNGELLLLFKRYLAKKKAQRYVAENQLQDNQIYLTYSHQMLFTDFPELGKEEPYDLAISFLGPHYLTAYKVSARKKAAWIHTDYSQIGLDREEDLKVYREFDYLVGVSQSVCNSFTSVFPELDGKVRVIENTLPAEMISNSAKEETPDSFEAEKINLLSIGRFCYAKNFENVPKICASLCQKGLDVHWYLIGYGGMQQEIEDQIREWKMNDRVTILGKKDNPYPYLLNCDVYVQPSRYEGCAVSVREAQMLEKPVVITSFNTANSQVEDGVDGLILPYDLDDFADRLAVELQNNDRLKRLAENCKKHDYSNRNEAKKIMELIQ